MTRTQNRPVTLPEGVSLRRVAEVLLHAWEAGPHQWTGTPAQLREGGRLIIPIGPPDSQQLQFIRMIGGQPVVALRELVRFVPLIRDRD